MPGPGRSFLTSFLVCLSVASSASAQYRVDPFTTSNGLPQNSVAAVLQTRDGYLWIATDGGAVRHRRGSFTAIGLPEGLLGVDVERRRGLFHAVDLPVYAYGQTEGRPPPVVTVESVLVEGKPAPIDGAVRVEPGQREVEINYTARGFSKPEHTQFRYRLDGLNDGWIDAGTRRTVHYSHLPPGDYTFLIQAADSEGRWSETGTGVRLVIRPAFYQTIWFSGAVLVAVGLAGAGLSWLRVHRLQEAERRLNIRIGEATAELAAANRRLEQLATIDALTQLANRRRFSDVLEQEWQRAMRDQSSLGLLMLDVDCFKRYNDTHGHQAGDACLQRVAGVLASRVKRPSDLAARYGGEEFAVVLPGTDEAGAVSVGEWIRAEVERQGIPHGASLAGDVVTVSIGAAVVTPAAGMAAASLVEAADAALYRAKEKGRNTVIAGMMDTSLDDGSAATRLSRMRIHHPGS